jgi:hypothetical protein
VLGAGYNRNSYVQKEVVRGRETVNFGGGEVEAAEKRVESIRDGFTKLG